MDLRTYHPRTLARLDTACGDRLLPFVNAAYAEDLEVDLHLVRAGDAHDLIAYALRGEAIVREATWRLPPLTQLPERIATAVLQAYVDALLAGTARFRARHGF